MMTAATVKVLSNMHTSAGNILNYMAIQIHIYTNLTLYQSHKEITIVHFIDEKSSHK